MIPEEVKLMIYSKAYHTGDKIVLEAQTANEAINVKWFQNDNLIKDSQEHF